MNYSKKFPKMVEYPIIFHYLLTMTTVDKEIRPRSEHRFYPNAIQRYQLWLFKNVDGFKNSLREMGINIQGKNRELAKRLEGVTAGIVELKNVVDGKYKLNEPKSEPILLLDILNNEDQKLLLHYFGRDFSTRNGKISIFVGLCPSKPNVKTLVLYQKTGPVTEKISVVEFFSQNDNAKRKVTNTHLLLPSHEPSDEVEFNKFVLPRYMQINSNDDLITATIRTREIYSNGKIPNIANQKMDKGQNGLIPTRIAVNPYSQENPEAINQTAAESYYEKLSTY